jgi:hypothetical protein
MPPAFLTPDQSRGLTYNQPSKGLLAQPHGFDGFDYSRSATASRASTV